MVWPGRNLALAILLPTLLSLLMVTNDDPLLKRVILGIDVGVAGFALFDMATLIRVKRLRISRICDPVASLGEPHQVELTIVNEGRRSLLLHLRDDIPASFSADPDEFLIKVAARAVSTVEYSMIPKRRGTFRMRRADVSVASRFRFWARLLKLPSETIIRVYPDVRQIARYELLARRDKLSILGLKRSRKLGTDNEFERLRDYAIGDEPRHIDWRATARRRKLTVRAHQVNQSQRVIFLIDSGRMMAGDTGGGLSPLDHALNAMLMLAHVALVRGDQVGLMVYADRVRAYVPPSGGAKRINRLVHAVHDLFPLLVESRHDRAFLELERRCRKRSLVIQMTNLFDDVGAKQLLDHLGNLVGKHLPLGVLLRDHDLFELADGGIARDAEPESDRYDERGLALGAAVYPSAAAASMLNWRERVLADLRKRGVLTLDVLPDELTAPLINKYLEVKARHLL
jgi:uncharacterized protein (DUF58 family)